MPPQPRRIEITFEKDGTSKVEAHGFAGMGCQQATAPYEEAIGKPGLRTLKPEAKVTARASQAVRQ